MIVLVSMVEDDILGTTAVISGPCGTIEIRELLWCVDREDILEGYYWQAWAVIQGAYHCCFSIPGKLTLLVK